jgi:pSer/pThr/pTyr-binding forkhead associated (FHA) protein
VATLRIVYVGPETAGALAPGDAREIAPGRVVSIGRGDSNDFVLPPPLVARAHAIVCLVPGADKRAVVCDLTTTNGTRVRGEKIAVAYLEPGEELLLADRFRFRIE